MASMLRRASERRRRVGGTVSGASVIGRNGTGPRFP
jgi:transcriptional regulator GlxA family with amidase domain